MEWTRASPRSARSARCARRGWSSGSAARRGRRCSRSSKGFSRRTTGGGRCRGAATRCGPRAAPRSATWPTLSARCATTSSASNTRGTVAFALDAVNCGETEGAADPCAPHRPACSAGDYCAYGGSTQIYVNLADNTHLDPRGFSPIAEVLGDGLAVLERIGERIGNLYGEVTELCPSQEELAALSSEGSLGNPYCILRNGTKQGVDPARLLEPDAEAYIEQKFAEIPRVRAVTVSTTGVSSRPTPSDSQMRFTVPGWISLIPSMTL